jgi:hypothetical protein
MECGTISLPIPGGGSGLGFDVFRSTGSFSTKLLSPLMEAANIFPSLTKTNFFIPGDPTRLTSVRDQAGRVIGAVLHFPDREILREKKVNADERPSPSDGFFLPLSIIDVL